MKLKHYYHNYNLMVNMKRLLLHIKYYFATKLLLKYLNISHLGKLDTEEDILITAVNLIKN